MELVAISSTHLNSSRIFKRQTPRGKAVYLYAGSVDCVEPSGRSARVRQT